MEIALLELLGRKCYVDGLSLVTCLLLSCLELCVHSIELLCSPVPELVYHLAVLGLLLLRDLAHLLHE